LRLPEQVVLPIVFWVLRNRYFPPTGVYVEHYFIDWSAALGFSGWKAVADYLWAQFVGSGVLIGQNLWLLVPEIRPQTSLLTETPLLATVIGTMAVQHVQKRQV
jgi:hypothetical protein